MDMLLAILSFIVITGTAVIVLLTLLGAWHYEETAYRKQMEDDDEPDS